jgi:hypothetical protein
MSISSLRRQSFFAASELWWRPSCKCLSANVLREELKVQDTRHWQQLSLQLQNYGECCIREGPVVSAFQPMYWGKNSRSRVQGTDNNAFPCMHNNWGMIIDVVNHLTPPSPKGVYTLWFPLQSGARNCVVYEHLHPTPANNSFIFNDHCPRPQTP